MQNRKGFTLIELLVVIAIIALLLSILSPVLSIVKKKARAVVCLSNLKQWGIAIVMYAVENEDKMWGDSYTLDDDLKVEGEWIAVLEPYYESIDEIRLCPSAKKPCEDTEGEKRGSVDTYWGVPGDVTNETRAGFWGSYGINRWATDPGTLPSWMGAGAAMKFWEKANVKNAQDIPVFLDATHWHFAPDENDPIPPKELIEYDDIPEDTGNQMWRVTINRHSDAINAAFLDGSVRKVNLWQLWDLRWHREFRAQKYERIDFSWL